MSFEAEVVDAAMDIRLEDVAPLALERAKIGISDTLGVALAGSRESIAVTVREFVAPAASSPGAGVWGTSLAAPVLDAVYANAVAAHALDWDDYSHPMHGHCSAILVPVCIVMGEALHRSGAEVVEAYLAGHEADAAIGAAATADHYKRGWHATSTVGVMGAAVCAARLLKLSPQQTRMALAIAASHSAGIRQNFGSTTKPLHAGHAARSGLMAALLAQKGVEGSEGTLTGRYGFLKLYADGASGAGDHGHDSSSSLSIEGDWGLVLKPYACCGSSHSIIDAVLSIMREEAPPADKVAAVECHIDPMVGGILTFHDPRTPMEARYSVEYPVAISILEGAAGAAQFVPEKISTPRVRDLMAKVRVIDDLSNSPDSIFGCRVLMRLADGSEIRREVEFGLGHPRNPMSKAQRMEKFTAGAATVLGDNVVGDLAAALDGLEHVEDIAVLAALLKPHVGAAIGR